MILSLLGALFRGNANKELYAHKSLFLTKKCCLFLILGMLLRSKFDLTNILILLSSLATDIEFRYTEDGEKVRVSKRTGRIIPVPDAARGTTKQTYQGNCYCPTSIKKLWNLLITVTFKLLLSSIHFLKGNESENPIVDGKWCTFVKITILQHPPPHAL